MSIISSVDYRLEGYHKKATISPMGDVVLLEFYSSYDEEANTYSDLKVRETRTYTRDQSTGLVTKREMLVEWLSSNESVIASKTITKYYSASEGYLRNQKSRINLIDQASLLLFATLMQEYGPEQGESNSLELLSDLASDIVIYSRGNRQPLITSVQGSTRAYMSQSLKDSLTVILDVAFIS